MSEQPVVRLQALDSEADGLIKERAELPERASLQAQLDEDAGLVTSRAEIDEKLEALRKDERAVEAEVSDIAARAKGFEDDLYSGRVTSPKELEVLQGELASCKAKQAEVEETELELMERGEGLEAEISAVDERRQEIETSCAAMREEIANQEKRIDGELARLEDSRRSVAPKVAEKLLAEYEKRRGMARLGGVVISELADKACTACRTVLPIMEVTRMKAEGKGSYAPCPSCQRLILL